MPSRRAFLGLLAGAAVDPERLLWVPGRKLISIPATVQPWRILTVRDYFDLLHPSGSDAGDAADACARGILDRVARLGGAIIPPCEADLPKGLGEALISPQGIVAMRYYNPTFDSMRVGARARVRVPA